MQAKNCSRNRGSTTGLDALSAGWTRREKPRTYSFFEHGGCKRTRLQFSKAHDRPNYRSLPNIAMLGICVQQLHTYFFDIIIHGYYINMTDSPLGSFTIPLLHFAI